MTFLFNEFIKTIEENQQDFTYFIVALIILSVMISLEIDIKKCERKGGRYCVNECVVPWKKPITRRWYNGDIFTTKFYIECGMGIKCTKDCLLDPNAPL